MTDTSFLDADHLFTRSNLAPEWLKFYHFRPTDANRILCELAAHSGDLRPVQSRIGLFGGLTVSELATS